MRAGVLFDTVTGLEPGSYGFYPLNNMMKLYPLAFHKHFGMIKQRPEYPFAMLKRSHEIRIGF